MPFMLHAMLHSATKSCNTSETNSLNTFHNNYTVLSFPSPFMKAFFRSRKSMGTGKMRKKHNESFATETRLHTWRRVREIQRRLLRIVGMQRATERSKSLRIEIIWRFKVKFHYISQIKCQDALTPNWARHFKYYFLHIHVGFENFVDSKELLFFKRIKSIVCIFCLKELNPIYIAQYMRNGQFLTVLRKCFGYYYIFSIQRGNP